MITKRDRDIIKHVESYGFITIKQCTDIFYNKPKYGYDLARKRLNKLVEHDYLKCFRNYSTNENVYYSEQNKMNKLTLHSNLRMNFYSKLISSGVEMVYFDTKKEVEWDDGKIKSDGFCIYKFEDYTFYNLLEIATSNNGDYKKLDRYEYLFDTGELQNKCKGTFPRIILIDDIEHCNKIELPRIEVVQLDFNLSNFSKIFL